MPRISVCLVSDSLETSHQEDLIEEVGRIYGVDNIKGKLPVAPMRMGHVDKTDREIRNKMISLGLNETLSYILINDKDVHKYTNDSFEELKLSDPMTEERNTLRYSLIPSLYKIYEYNKAHYTKDVCIYEVGKGFWKKDGTYGEDKKLCALMTGEYYLGLGMKKAVDFYIIKGVAEEILDYLGYNGRYTIGSLKTLLGNALEIEEWCKKYAEGKKIYERRFFNECLKECVFCGFFEFGSFGKNY